MLAEDHAFIQVAVQAGANEGYQFKTHPNIDKALYSARSLLGLKDADRPFPAGSPLSILKWRMQVGRAACVFLSHPTPCPFAWSPACSCGHHLLLQPTSDGACMV